MNPLIPRPKSIQFFPRPPGDDRPLPNVVSWHGPLKLWLGEGCEALESNFRRTLPTELLPIGSEEEAQVTLLLRQDSLHEGHEGGYSLDATHKVIRITASKLAGLRNGLQTLRQLIEPRTEGFDLPCVMIIDWPDFEFRSWLLDVSRHFFSVDDVKRYLELMARFKYNYFHIHLTDDSGWRLESKKYPLLTEKGGWRRVIEPVWDYFDIHFPGKDSGEPLYGGFYSHDEMREIVAYAGELGITVIPEIDIPGHSMAALVCYPELACTPESIEIFKKESGMPFANVYCAGKESTFEFLENVLDEVLDIFPSPWIHIGGDEVRKGLWQHCEYCQKRMRDEGLADENELQSYVIRRIEKYLNAKSRSMLGWDEILEGGLAPNATVVSWRGMQGGIDAARAGHKVVMAPWTHTYFDYDYEALPLDRVLEFKIVPPELSPEEAELVLGSQANAWTEYLATTDDVDRFLFPRALALAEVMWAGNPDPTEFKERLAAYEPKLRAMGVNVWDGKPITGPRQIYTPAE